MKPRIEPLEGHGAGLICESVTWEMLDRRGQQVIVRFCYEDGKPSTISLFWGDCETVAYVEDNRNGTWQSCITHVIALIRHVAYRPKPDPKKPRKLSEHERQKIAKSKPELKVFA
jgi:hypothetical protein